MLAEQVRRTHYVRHFLLSVFRFQISVFSNRYTEFPPSFGLRVFTFIGHGNWMLVFLRSRRRFRAFRPARRGVQNRFQYGMNGHELNAGRAERIETDPRASFRRTCVYAKHDGGVRREKESVSSFSRGVINIDRSRSVRVACRRIAYGYDTLRNVSDIVRDASNIRIRDDARTRCYERISCRTAAVHSIGVRPRRQVFVTSERRNERRR